MQLIKNLEWRYATKKFDKTRKISNPDLKLLLDAANLSPSSYGLQPYKIIIVDDPSIRAKLREASWNQSQISDASHLVIFCNYTKFGKTEIDEFIKLTAETRNISYHELKGYADFMIQKIGEKSEDELKRWSSNQAYIALGNMLSAGAELGIDSCPMEGFDASAYNRILSLDKQNLSAAVVVTLGYRSEDDSIQHLKKVRKPLSRLVEFV